MKKNHGFQILLWVILVLTSGVGVGIYFHDEILSSLTKIHDKLAPPKRDVYACPSPSIAQAHQYDAGQFQAGNAYWQTDFHGWEAPEKIGFMQVLIDKTHNVICYYRWPNPQDKGSNLWMTIHWVPDGQHIPKPYGPYWVKQKEKNDTNCVAGIHACGFVMSQDLQ